MAPRARVGFEGLQISATAAWFRASHARHSARVRTSSIAIGLRRVTIGARDAGVA
jgi:hypothetical protein